MNNKFYIGDRAASFEAYNEIGPITSVSVIVDDDTEYLSGSKDGFVLEVNCPYGTQQMANDILTRVNGKTYKGYRADGAELDPSAELGDGITIRGLYSMLAFRSASFGPEHMSEIAAPGEGDVGHEFPYITETERKIRQSQATVNEWLQKQDIDMKAAIDSATQQITGAKGGYVVIRYNDYGQPYEILIMDTDDINTAKNVWRWNSAGFGHSDSGYAGPYDTAITQDGAIVADFITTGTLVATLIKTGILQSKDGETFYLDLDQGILRLKASSLSISGQTVDDIAQNKADSALNSAKSYTDATASSTLNSAKEYADSVGDFVTSTIDPKIAEMQKQLDGQIETYYYDYEPALNKAPSSAWSSEADKQKHEGDLFFWKSKGYAYRFLKDGNTWKWQMVQDTDITQALQKADAAQDTADNKRRVFVAQPTPPYDVGDLWVQGPNGDIYKCKTSKSSGSYSSGDWELASKYTDDAALNDFIKGDFNTLKTQTDKKAETWYQATDPSTSWASSAYKDHTGDLWYNSSSTVQKYYRWDGAKWQELTATPPTAVFNQINGKAQIFVGTTEPKPPYYKGDLWFKSESSDILTCTTARTSSEKYNSGDWKKYNKYTDDSALNNFITGDYADDIKSINGQIDKKAETWYQSADPSAAWTTTTVKNEHIGDMWYCTNSSDTTHYQKSWVWRGSSWSEMKANPPQDVFNTINGKAQIFIGTTPTVPYYKGDLWFQSSTSDIMTCITTRTSGSYTSSEWQKRNKYIDQAAANTAAKKAVDGQTQEDIFNKLTGGGKNQGLYLDGTNLYVNASYIKSGTMVADRIQGGTLTLGGKNNGYGEFIILNEDDNEMFHFNNNGFMSSGGAIYNGVVWYGKIEIAGPSLKFYAGNKDDYIEALEFRSVGYVGSRTYWGERLATTYSSPVFEIATYSEDSSYQINDTERLRQMGITKSYGHEFTGNVYISGNLNGKAISSLKTVNIISSTNDFGEINAYSSASTSPIFSDIGSGRTDENGECHVAINPVFSETIANMEYYVFLQKEGDGDLYIAEKEPTYFLVRGTPNLRFAWEVKAHQRDYEYAWLDDIDAMEINSNEFDVPIKEFENMYNETMQKLIDEQEAALHEAA